MTVTVVRWVDGQKVISEEDISVPQPTGQDVNRERDRRVREGLIASIPGYGNVPLDGDEITIRNLQGLALAAQLRLSQGNTTTITQFRDRDNVIHDLSPSQVLLLWQLGSNHMESLFQSAWALKDNPNGIPMDYNDDTHWT